MKINCTVIVEIFKSETTGYTVFIGQTEDMENIHFVGNALDITEGSDLELEGTWDNHSKYGKQFKFTKYTKLIPQDEKGIIRYLATAEIKGIGEAIAKRIVDAFGLETFDTIRYRPQELVMIKGISEEKALELSDHLNKEWEKLNLITFLQKYDVSINVAGKIYEIYGSKALDKIKENPYNMLEDITSIDFKVVDKIGKNLGIAFDDDYRINSGIIFALTKIVSFGHVCVELDNLVPYAADLLGISKEGIINGITRLAIDKKVYLQEFDDVTFVYGSSLYLAEDGTAQKIFGMATDKASKKKLDKELNVIEENMQMTFSPQQKVAIKAALNNRLSVITGGPGTGKTTIIKGIIDLIRASNKSFVLCAPTGRAAKRITQTTGVEAKTLHRLLEITRIEDNNMRQMLDYEIKKINADIVIVDEMSMIDIMLMNNLMKAMRTKTRLVLVGDVDQLPSVGPGCVLKDLIDSGCVVVTKLDQIYRQSANSDIITNAHIVNAGNEPIFKEDTTDMYLLKTKNIQETVNKVKQLLEVDLATYISCDNLKDVQVLTPMKKTDLGSINLNSQIQKVLNPLRQGMEEKEHLGRHFRVGDKIMQMENNYDIAFRQQGIDGQGIYNGDIGYITEISKECSTLSVLFDDDKEVDYKFDELLQIDLAYAVTVHKSQGSEFDVVILPLLTGYTKLFTRNLLYTAMTRAKKLLIVIGSSDTIKFMVNNIEEKKRKTGLKYKLKEYVDRFDKMAR
ncbi:MAG: ATP-dependent RecD-like DNA helicase [Clostridia bacterium]